MLSKEILNTYRKEYRERIIGRWLKKQRINSDLTQAQLANLLGWPTSQHIANIENGNSSLPPEKVKLLYKALTIDPEYVMQLLLKVEELVFKTRIYNRKF